MGVPSCEIKKVIKEWLEEELRISWEGEDGPGQAKRLIGLVPPTEWVKEARNLPRDKLRLVVGWLTGHWRINYHLHNMGISYTDGCRWCGSERETTEHLLCQCPKYMGLRQRMLGSSICHPEELRDRTLGEVYRLARALNSSLSRVEGQ